MPAVELDTMPTGTITVPVARGLLAAWGWSHRDLARVLGVSRRSVRRWLERDRRDLPQFVVVVLLLATDAVMREWLMARFGHTHTFAEDNDDVSQGDKL